MNKQYVYLSHFISNATPLYGGALGISIVPAKQIKAGDSCNTLQLTFPNHVSTHVDFPRHFSEEGKSVNDYQPEDWIFHSVSLIDHPATKREIISLTEVLGKIPPSTDLLLVRTGFQTMRQKEEYWRDNPGLSPKSAKELKQHCPSLRAVGMDFISVSSYADRPLGREAHKCFLLEQDILLIEDMNLEDVNKQLTRVVAFPLLVDNADGTPMTVIGEIAG